MNDFITVRSLLESNKRRLKLKLLCSVNGLNKKIVTGELHRPGLALSGFTGTFTYNRIQILGNTEISFLNELSDDELQKSIDKVVFVCSADWHDIIPFKVYLTARHFLDLVRIDDK